MKKKEKKKNTIKKENLKRRSICLKDLHWDKLVDLADKDGRAVADYIRRILIKFLEV